MISLDLTKSSEVRKAGDQPNNLPYMIIFQSGPSQVEKPSNKTKSKEQPIPCTGPSLISPC